VAAAALLASASLVSCNPAPEPDAQAEGAPAAQNAAVPDFYTSGLGWHSRTTNVMPPPARTPGAHGPIGNHPDHPFNANSSGLPPTERIGNHEHPLLLPHAAEQMRKENEEVLGGKWKFVAVERCWPLGVPGILNATAEPVLFLQTPDEVTLVYQRGQIVRHIHLNQEHPDGLKPSWYGHSVGRYEGDTLVVDTVGLDPRALSDVFGVPQSAQMHVVERYRIIDGSPEIITGDPRPIDRYFSNPANKVLQVIATIEDPGTFREPFTVQQLYEPADGPLEESICQQNNDDKLNLGLREIPMDETPDF
jgi:hypothetical protein